MYCLPPFFISQEEERSGWAIPSSPTFVSPLEISLRINGGSVSTVYAPTTPTVSFSISGIFAISVETKNLRRKKNAKPKTKKIRMVFLHFLRYALINQKT